jgi:hypothetical protein
MLTVVFAVYALALLVTLLLCGGLSDALGRKPVIAMSLIRLGVSQCLFLIATDVRWLIAARITQGVGTGLATAAVSAALLDQQPAERPGLGAQVMASGSTAGLAVGALISGALVQYAPAPTRLTYGVILVATVALAVLAHRVIYDTTTPRYRPRPNIDVHAPPAIRPAFYAALPCLISAWAVSGFYLSLGPSLANALTGQDHALVGGGTVAVLTGCSTMGAVAANRLAPRAAMLLRLWVPHRWGHTDLGSGRLRQRRHVLRQHVDRRPRFRRRLPGRQPLLGRPRRTSPARCPAFSHPDRGLSRDVDSERRRVPHRPPPDRRGFRSCRRRAGRGVRGWVLLTPAYRAPDLDRTSTPRAGPACSTDPVPAPRRMPDNNNALATPQPG